MRVCFINAAALGALLLSLLTLYPLHAAAAGSSASSSVRIDEQVNHYPVFGDTLEALRAQLQHEIPLLQGAAGTHGRTSSDVAIAYEFDKTEAGCRLRNLEVHLDIVVTLPEWVPGKAVSTSLQQRWEQALAALQRHEATHRANARAAAEEARAQILAIGLQPDCRSVRRMASQQLQRAMLKCEFRDRRYDARTRNGIEEGAVL